MAWTAGLDFPDLPVQHALLALRPAGSYPLDSGTPTLHSGYAAASAPLAVFPVAEFEQHVVKAQVPHSTAPKATADGRHLTGPLAHWRIAADLLPPELRRLGALAGLEPACDNPFRSIVVRAVEVLWAVWKAQRLLDAYEPPPGLSVPVLPRAGVGHAATEAPRRLLYHRYEIAADGTVVSANIVPPTAQNQAAIEADLREFVQQRLHLDDGAARAALRLLCDEGTPADRFGHTDGEATRLFGLWQGRDLVVVIDAVHAHPGEPGRIHRLDLARAALLRGGASTHGLGLGARAAPRRSSPKAPPAARRPPQRGPCHDRRLPCPADPFAPSCPAPLRDDEGVLLGHGAGGRLPAELLEGLLLPETKVVGRGFRSVNCCRASAGPGAPTGLLSL
ncbi:hypothetical protein ABH931_007081 [Streptacidiphilus sp. MAP12-33]|uniref:hypothetical protein n=1 Tax=Streptacidiphilus sp. MAP12-33 TaxID=3156266 RepID=UPI0035189C06